jgi:anti-sigma-K factor RskA
VSTNGRTCGEDVAAYVLGALEPAEAEAFRRHLADCAACQEEVQAFQQVTDTLPARRASYELPRGLRRRVMREVRATPQAAGARRIPLRVPLARGSLAWAGALGAAAVAVIVAVALSSGGTSGTRVIQASVGSAELRIAGGHADLVVHRLPRLSGAFIYEMWVQRGKAQPVPTGTLFSTTVSGTASVGVPGSLHGVTAIMVTQEPAGGTPVPTGAPVIVARVS